MRTIQRWRKNPGGEDRRSGPHSRPHNALSPTEEAQILSILESSRYAGLSPKQLVPQLADEGLYLASESTIYRIQCRYGLRQRRQVSRTHVTRACTMHCATQPNQVWSWDITLLPTVIRGSYLYLYLIMDVWSRRIVGWRVAAKESAEIAADVMAQACRDGNLEPRGLVLHSDNGAAMRGNTMISTLKWLGVVPSFSRPHVSNDNPYSEALFRTLKHVPMYPRQPFAGVESAQRWVSWFVDWYNRSHRHSAIRYVTPDQRHFGEETDILRRRRELYERVRRSNPERWSGETRNWAPTDSVTLNPETCSEQVTRQLP